MKTYKDLSPAEILYSNSDFNYQKELTTKLDNSSHKPIDQELINVIVLWKIARYAKVEPGTLDLLNQIDPDSKTMQLDLVRVLFFINY